MSKSVLMKRTDFLEFFFAHKPQASFNLRLMRGSDAGANTYNLSIKKVYFKTMS